MQPNLHLGNPKEREEVVRAEVTLSLLHLGDTPTPASSPATPDWEYAMPDWEYGRSTLAQEVTATSWTPPSGPEIASLAMPNLRVPKSRIPVKSFHFAPEAASSSTPRTKSTNAPDRSSRRSDKQHRDKRTRIRAPRDVVRMEDRLGYLLQPPLESLLADELLELPFTPFDYQLDGIAFLFPRHHAVLADEMGLGKTMQAATTIRLLVRSGQARKILLVCPKPLITNWQREFALWAPELPLTVISGPQARREFQWQQRGLITLVNYETLVRDEKIVQELELHFDLVALDESQRIKNRSGTTNQVVRKISRNRSWALTGTPIENSTDDLVGIFDFVAPGSLHPGMKPSAMGRAISDVVLRRTKDVVMNDLPPKLINDTDIDLTPEQWETYRRAEDDGVVQLGELGDDITLQHVFQLVLRLKQICNFDPVTGESAKRDRLAADLEECAASGRKAIVFSQWVESIEKLADSLQRFNPAQYHGKIPHNQRDGVLKRFKEDPDCHVILMSYGAGSVGLNLQFAGYVFLFDRWWNPAVEDQAINRAHRIGASGPVTVSRFLAAGTIERRIDQILAEKRELFDAVFNDSPTPRKMGLSRDELFSLFDLQTPGGQLGRAA